MEITENPFTEALLDALEGYQEPYVPEPEDMSSFKPFPYDDDELPF